MFRRLQLANHARGEGASAADCRASLVHEAAMERGWRQQTGYFFSSAAVCLASCLSKSSDRLAA